jgi:hypothetical protein
LPQLSKEVTMKTLVVLAVAMVLAASFTPLVSGQAPAHKFVTPDELTWNDIPSLPKGAKIAVLEGPLNEAVPVTFRLKLPANYEIPAHWHPGIEHVTVISGGFNMGAGDKLDKSKTHALTPGSVAIMQPKTPHFGWTSSETIVQVHGIGPWGVTYVNEADDPRKK